MDKSCRQRARQIIKKADLIIAADGGIHHCLQLGISPNFLIGDLDSTPNKLVKTMEDAGISVLPFPPEKDQTDLELALDLALEQNCHKIFLFGGLGSRWDMSLANIFLAASAKYSTMKIIIFDQKTTIQTIKAGQTITLQKKHGRIVSLIPLRGDAKNISVKGFKYKLEKEGLSFGSTRGISNLLEEDKGTVELKSGLLLCVQG